MYIEILRVIIGSHNLLIPGCYMYMPDEVFHDWKSIRIKEEEEVYCIFVTSVSNIFNCELIPSVNCEFKSRSWRDVLDTTLWDKIGQWLATGGWFSLDTPVSSTNKTDCHDIAEILLSGVKHHNPNLSVSMNICTEITISDEVVV